MPARLGFFLTISLLVPLSAWSQTTKHVMVLHEGNGTHPANVIADEVFREAFGSGPQHHFFSEYIDEDRLGANDDVLAELLRKKYVGRRMDLVILDGWPAVKFAVRHGEKLWPGTPKVFYFLDSRELANAVPPNMTGVAGIADYGAILDLALHLRPKTRRVFYVGGVNAWEEAWRGFAEQDFKRFAGRVEITYLNGLAFPALLDRLGRLPDDSAVIYAELLRDASGHIFVPARVSPVIAAASSAPVYGPFDTYVGSGIVGGVVLDYKALASQTARLGQRVLDQGTVARVPIETATTRIVLDWRQLRRWDISEARLPTGSSVLFREPGMWEQYRYAVIGALAVFAIQTALIAGLLLQRRRRRRAESIARNLAGRLLTAQEAERTRIARDLHDDACQEVAGVAVDISNLLQRGGDIRDANVRNALTSVQTRTVSVAESLRLLSHHLHPGVLQHVGLVAALETHCAEVERHYDMQVSLKSDGAIEPRAPAVALALFRITQEALRNAARHGRARHAMVTLVRRDGDLVLSVADDGEGFDPTAARANGGLGLVSIEERARLVNGLATIQSGLRHGTTIEVRVPIDIGGEADDALLQSRESSPFAPSQKARA